MAFASLLRQVVPLAGVDGMSPIRPQLDKIRADYPLWRCLLSFPTLLWIRADDWCLRLLVVLGLGGSAWTVYGGPWSPLGLLLCWMCYLSLQHACGLVYPWDCLLLEAGFLALFLPATNALPDCSTAALPLPAVAWAFRWLLFRVLFGFGKFKFARWSRREPMSLRGFFVAMPLPSVAGWYVHCLPARLLQLGLVALFLVEVPVPFLVFFLGYPRLVAAAVIVGLMVGIQFTGNFGHFNALMVVLCVPLLDSRSTLFDQPLDASLSAPGTIAAHAVVLILFVGSLVYLPTNSWRTLAWVYRPSLFKARPAPLRWLFAFYRLLAPFRLVHAYGVFPEINFPAARVVTVIEGTRDGKTWQEYACHSFMTAPTSAPVLVAPHTPRFDQYLFYEACGVDVANFLGSTFGFGNPYHFGPASGLRRVVQRILEGAPCVRYFFRITPFPDKPPIAVRVNWCLLEPATAPERRAGTWWRRHYLGPHLPPVVRDDALWDEWLPEPELFHPDELIWKLRTPRLRTLFDRAHAGADPTEAVVDPAAGISADDLREFWSRFLPTTDPHERHCWKGLAALVERLRETFSRAQLRLFERVHGRLCLALFARIEPHFLGHEPPALPLETLFEVWLLTSHLIAEGPETYAAVYREPALAPRHVPHMTNESGLFLTALFRYEALAAHASKFRLLLRFYTPRFVPGLSGFVKLIPFLAGQFANPDKEHYPDLTRTPEGDWVIQYRGEPGSDA